MSNLFEDWLLRYGFICKIRADVKSKDRFIRSLLKDVSLFRKDVKVIEHEYRANSFKNIYIGNLKKANKVVMANYDTPIKFFGDYFMFNRNKQVKKTLLYIVLSSLLLIFIGLLGTILFIKFSAKQFSFGDIKIWFGIFAFGIYFYILGKCTKGLKSRKNIVNNTSSIICMLHIISKTKKNNIAYVFYDSSNYSNIGLEVVMNEVNKDAKIYILNSIGANGDIRYIKCGNIEYIFASDIKNEELNENYIGSTKLKSKHINKENLKQVTEYILK